MDRCAYCGLPIKLTEDGLGDITWGHILSEDDSENFIFYCFDHDSELLEVKPDKNHYLKKYFNGVL